MELNNIQNLLSECEPQNYIFEFECGVEAYINLHPIERYFTYIATESDPKVDYFSAEMIAFTQKSKEAYPTLADCDGSGTKGNNSLIHDVYKTLFGWEKGRETFGSIEGFDCLFGGETMNSVFYPLIDIVGDSIKQIRKNPVMIKFSKNHLIDYFAQKETHKDFVSVLQNTYGLIDYLNSYHTLGNFTLVPAKFNGYRGIKLRDYWDDSLNYLMNNGFEDTPKDTGKFDKNQFVKYVNYFFLWDYINTSGQHKSLNPQKGELYYFRQRTCYIYRRGIFMTTMLRLNVLLGQGKYNEMRKVIFGRPDRIYTGYDEVIDEIKRYLSHNETEMLLENCKHEIGRIC